MRCTRVHQRFIQVHVQSSKKESGRMAKKKTNSEVTSVTTEATEVQEEQSERVASEEVAEEVSAQEAAEGAESSENSTVVSDAAAQEVVTGNLDAVSEAESAEASSEDVPSDPLSDGQDSALHTTGRVNLDEAYNDEHVLTRLRGGRLAGSDLYREAQLFGAHDFDVDSLLRSHEMPLVLNVVCILNLRDEFYPAELDLLTVEDAELQEIVCRNVISKMRRGIVSFADIADMLEAAGKSGPLSSGYLVFAEKYLGCIRGMIVQQDQDMPSQMNALTRICALLPDALFSRVLLDPSPYIRASVIRSFASRQGVNMNDLTVILIMLKDRNEIVDIAIMRMLSRFTPFVDLVVPPVLECLSNASEMLRSEINDVFRAYGNDAVAPVMMGLEDVRDTIYFAVRDVIAQSPQRYTDALLERLESVRTRDYVRERVVNILIGHKDDSRRLEILTAVNLYKAPERDEPPEWQPPETGSPKFATPATECRDVYLKILDDAELDAFSETCDHEMLMQLLNDASENARINALHLIRRRGSADADVRERARIWIKTPSVPLALAALDAYLTVENDLLVAMDAVSNALACCVSDDVRDLIFEELAKHQDKVNGIIDAYYEMPRKRAIYIHRLLRLKPSEETFKRVLGGLERDRSVACIYETLALLLKTGYIFDNMPLRPILIDLVVNPVSKGQFGLMTRIMSLRLLRRYMTEQSDPESVASLQKIYKENKNAEIRQLAKDLLKDLGEEIFDLDDEFDDFEDLNDEEDED